MQPGLNTTETSSALWDAALSAVSTPSRARGRIKKSEIVHFPEFDRASSEVDDPFWKDILRNCSRKKFPRGFTYTDGYLHNRNKNVSIALPDDDLAFANTAIYFFQENGKLYSKRDQELRKIQDEQHILEHLALTSNSWTCVARSKNHRSTHVRDYVERKYAHISEELRNELYTQINVGFEDKFITKEHIVFENGQVQHIDGIDADETHVFLTRPLPTRRLSYIQREDAPKDKCYRHYENWCKYLEDYRKFLTTSIKSAHTVQTSDYGSTSGRYLYSNT